MRKALALSVLAVAFAAPAAAQSTMGMGAMQPGMGAMQYYVGVWSCLAAPVGRPPVKATATFTLDSGLMRQWVSVPAQGKMTKPLVISIATTYDAKKRRYFETYLDSAAGWSVSSAKPFSGKTEQWTDEANDSGKLGHGQTVRTNSNSFVYTAYPTLTAPKPVFRVTCNRSS